VSVVVVGVHERDVPLGLLEQVSVADADLAKALRRLCDSPHLSEAVIVSTCMRTEVYAVVERFHDGVSDIEEFFESRAASNAPAGPDGGADPYAGTLSDHLYVAFDDMAAAHLFEVAAGIDSAVLGEGEVLRQVRHAAERARSEKVAGPVLGRMFRHALEAGKRARAETSIARGITSLSHAAVALATERLGGSLGGQHVLVVGAGEMGSGMSRALSRSAVPARLVVASRTRARALEIAGRLGGEAVDLATLRRAVAEADVLLTSTASPRVLFEAADVAQVMAARAGRPLLVVDAAVPRDVDPAVGAIEGVTLLDMDDIRGFAETQMAGRAGEVERVREIIGEELERFRAANAARTAVPVISALRAHAESLRLAELERHAAKLEALDPAAKDAVEAATRAIVSKLLHEPTVRLRDSAGTARGDRLSEALRALFDL
jgi:glutamyl-tRNA reductase